MMMSREELFDFVVKRNQFLVNEPVSSLREWISKCRITVTDFSRMLDIDRAYIHKIMSGKRNPSASLLQQIKSVTNGKIKTELDLIDLI